MNLIKIFALLNLFVINWSFAQYETTRETVKCEYRAGISCYCDIIERRKDVSDGPYHGSFSNRYYKESCPKDIYDRMSSDFMAYMHQNQDFNPDDYRQQDLTIPTSPQSQFWSQTLANSLSRYFQNHSNQTQQSLIDSIRGWAPYNPQLAQDVANFRQQHTLQNGQLEKSKESMAKYMEDLLESLKNPSQINPVALDERPTPIPATVNKDEAIEYFNNLHDLAKANANIDLAKKIQDKLQRLPNLSSEEKRFYQTELYRTYLGSDNTFKSLPLVNRPEVNFNTQKNSAVGSLLRGQFNETMAVQSKINSLLQEKCLVEDCSNVKDLMRTANAISRFNEIYTDIQRLDRAVSDWNDTGDYQQNTEQRVNETLSELEKIETLEQLDEFLESYDGMRRSVESSSIYTTTTETVTDNNNYPSEQMKAASDTSSISSCLTDYQECLENGQLEKHLNQDNGSGPQEEIFQIRGQAQKVLKLKDSIENSNLYSSDGEIYLLSQGLFSTVGDSIANTDESRDELISYAQTFTDIALGLTPGVGLVKDLYEATTGKNMVTGQEMENWERAISAVSVATLGLGSQMKSAGKVLIKMGTKINLFNDVTSVISKSTISMAVHLYDSTKGLALRGTHEIGKLLKTSAGNTWARIRTIGNTVSDYGYKLFDKTSKITNEIPADGYFARVMPREFAESIKSGMGTFTRESFDQNTGKIINEAFITRYDELSKISGHQEVSKYLGLYNNAAGTSLRELGSDSVIVKFKFKGDIEQTLRSPIELKKARDYGFIHGGKTKGGASEYLINNDAAKKGLIDLDSVAIEEIKL